MIREYVRSLQVRLPSGIDTSSAQAHEQRCVLGHELGYRDAGRDRLRLIEGREPTAVAVLDPSGRHRARLNAARPSFEAARRPCVDGV